MVQAIWDPGNALMAGELPYPDGYAAIKDFVVHVHIKDAALLPSAPAPEWAVVGTGAIDFSGQLAALKRDNYNGWLSLETHLARPTKEAASRACLDGLQRLLAAV